jgi:ribosomal protein S10
MIRKESVMEQWSIFVVKRSISIETKQQLIDFIENIVLQEQDDMKNS